VSDSDVRTILHRLAQLAEQMKRITGEVAEVKEHVRKTNGRVRELELWKARMEGLKAGYSWLPPVVGGVIGAGLTKLIGL